MQRGYFVLLYIVFYLLVIKGHPKESSIKQINVILFFAENDHSPKSYEGLKILEMHEIARAKLNVPVTRSKKYSYVTERNAQNCEEMLWEGLESLTHFCQNALGMKTATISVSSAVIPNAQCRDDHAKLTPDTTVAQEEERPRRRYLRFGEDEGTPLLGQQGNMEIVTAPRHTEIFKIRVKRNQPEIEEKPMEIQDVPLERERGRPAWDVFDVMSHVRFSFFGKLFEKDNKQFPDEPPLPPNVIGERKPDPGLFEAVMATLENLQETREPFLLVVFGGRISTVDDVHSPLVQTMKHVTENTEPSKTLLVLGPGCPQETPSQSDDQVVSIVEGGKRPNASFPIFAMGPKNEKLKALTTIYDIPITVRSILEEMAPNFGESSNMQHLSYDRPANRVKRNSGNRNNDVLFIIFSVTVALYIM